jgi:heme/copper-type cytochrome/quinol oxidase subunit 2
MEMSGEHMSAAAAIVVALLVLVGVIISLAITIFFILTLQKALNRCSPENRAMQPGMIWLMLIPLFNIVWIFFVVINISKSLSAEFTKRGIASDPEPGKTLGLAYAILAICSAIPLVGFLAGIGCLVCFIMYWVKIAGYSKQLELPISTVA